MWQYFVVVYSGRCCSTLWRCTVADVAVLCGGRRGSTLWWCTVVDVAVLCGGVRWQTWQYFVVQTWQYFVVAYALTCIVPFSLVLLLGPGLLQDRLISLPHFFLASLLPLPFLVHWLYIRLRPARRDRSITAPQGELGGGASGARGGKGGGLSPEATAMLQILQGPFKATQLGRLGPICGQVCGHGVMKGRGGGAVS